MAMNPNVWGPHYWFVLHTIALTYPLKPNDISKKKYYNFINDLPLFIPHTESAKTFSNLLDKYPVTPYLDSRASFNKWVHFVHNKINLINGSEEINMTEAMNRYNDLYKPKSQEIIDNLRFKEQMITMGVICSLSILCVIAYRS